MSTMFTEGELAKPLTPKPTWCGTAIVLALAVGFGVGVHVLSAYMKARAYNRVTGENVSTWDTFWDDSRVQDRPKR